jgi:hypothetical protein
MTEISIENIAVSIRGRLFRTAWVRDEPYDCVAEPNEFIKKLKRFRSSADLFTFTQEIGDEVPKHDLHLGWERLAVLPITTYNDWFDEQIGFKPRNKIRKAQKAGVKLRCLEFNDECIQGIMGIYNESPLVQGRHNWHYGKDFETMKKMLGTFPDRSEFVGAFYGDEMIGFIKLVRGKRFGGLMHILSKNSHRDKAPTNALVAKAVEICAERKLSYLQYGIWSRRGLGDFKTSNCFKCLSVPRYFVPLNIKGGLMLKLGLHRKYREYIPNQWWDTAVIFRNKWNKYWYRGS